MKKAKPARPQKLKRLPGDQRARKIKPLKYVCYYCCCIFIHETQYSTSSNNYSESNKFMHNTQIIAVSKNIRVVFSRNLLRYLEYPLLRIR